MESFWHVWPPPAEEEEEEEGGCRLLSEPERAPDPFVLPVRNKPTAPKAPEVGSRGVFF